MGYPTKVQLISRKKGADQYYINFPTAVAEAMEFQKGEIIEWIIEDKANIIAHRPVVPPSPVTIEKNDTSLLNQCEALWQRCQQEVSSSPSCIQRLREHLLAHLLCPGRHTVSAPITTFGKQFRDWTADYSLYSKDRVKAQVIFKQVRQEVELLESNSRPLCLALDDTILRKVGKPIPGTAYRKDPLGPPFNLNLVWAQRRLQLSAAVAD